MDVEAESDEDDDDDDELEDDLEELVDLDSQQLDTGNTDLYADDEIDPSACDDFDDSECVE